MIKRHSLKVYPSYLSLIGSLAFSGFALAEIPAFTKSGNVISWEDTGGWMQVQETVNYTTAPGCEGFITTCTLEPGTYQLVDHSSGMVEPDIRITQNSVTPGGDIDFTIVKRECSFLPGAHPNGTVNCLSQCPTGSVFVAASGCQANWQSGGDLPVKQIPVMAGNATNFNGSLCSVINVASVDASRALSERIEVMVFSTCAK